MSAGRRSNTPELFSDSDLFGTPPVGESVESADDSGSDDNNHRLQSPKSALKELYPDLSDSAISLILKNGDQKRDDNDENSREHSEKSETSETADQSDLDASSREISNQYAFLK